MATDERSEGSPIVRRYHRIERAFAWLVAILAAIAAVAAVLSLPFAVGLLVAVGLLAVLRIPLFQRRITTRLETDADPEAVAADFGGSTPPMLVFQWGLADEAVPTADGARYEFSYLFGLRSLSMATDVRSVTAPADDASRVLELDVTAGGEPWARYRVSIRGREAGTVVDIEGVSTRRFGLRGLPQGLVAGYYYADALEVLGYTVADRTASLSVRSVRMADG